MIVSEVLRICLLRKRIKTLELRKTLFKDDVSEDTLKIMESQTSALQVRIRDTFNKITKEKLILMRLKKTLAQEFDWPVEELLRQLKNKLDADVAEISM